MVLFKVGNDLRCDQLVLQIVSLMGMHSCSLLKLF